MRNLHLTFVLCKAKLLKEDMFFLIHLIARYVLVMKKLEIEKTKPTFIKGTFYSEDVGEIVTSPFI